ncbi:MAG: LPS export ABC transporter permease LptF [Dechloromonas sp.]|nr:LPS export ABC transporter permease LptF [Dechloromonas sp.]
MIFERAARREFAQAAAGISVALLAILTSINLIRLLKEAVGGRIAPEGVAALLGYAALNFMSVLLSLTLFVAVLLSISRVYRDSEMVVWLSSGQPLQAWIRPVIRFSLPILLAIAVVAGFLAPWANQSSADYRQRLALRSELSHVSPGAFREVKNGQRVFFVEQLAEDASAVGNVFVASVQDGRVGVVMSDKAHQHVADNGDRFIVLEQGRRYEVEAGSPAFRIMDFERYLLRTEDGTPAPAERVAKRQPINELIKMPDAESRAELLWRLGLPISSLVLALLAIPLAYVNPRAGRSANLLLAILVFAIYNNLMSISQSWVAQGKLSFVVGLLATHGLMSLPALALFYRRTTLWRPWWRRQNVATRAPS